MNGFGIVGIVIVVIGAVVMLLCFQTAAWDAAKAGADSGDDVPGGMAGLIRKLSDGLPGEEPRKMLSYTGAVLMLAGIVIVLVSLGSRADEYIR